MAIRIVERDDGGRLHYIDIVNDEITVKADSVGSKPLPFAQILSKVFLPAGYPDSVTPDYLRYQVFNALQAFCSSLASLLSSRAVLEGFGVGDPSASATNALLLSVVLDFFGRMTTIVSAYFIGTSLVPESKTYRFLADILNDSGIVLETLIPVFVAASKHGLPSLRVPALCLSASLRSLCGVAAGGSKAAISLHFATPVNGKGDLGDLNAKDASKETVLALMGMLIGTLIVPHITTPSSTYTMLVTLVSLHLALNYYGVRGLALRTLNRQRASFLWSTFRQTKDIPSPAAVSEHEHIFANSSILKDVMTGRVLGSCIFASNGFEHILATGHGVPPFDLFKTEQYVLWFDRTCISNSGKELRSDILYMNIVLKKGHGALDHLKAWVHAYEVGKLLAEYPETTDPTTALCVSYASAVEHLPSFLTELAEKTWIVEEGGLVTTLPRKLLVEADVAFDGERRKDQ
ncbi:vitamin B6 photo-protection and homoeostasis-domain-containing protein [Desarmillaria ectypa]|nr:vitamin B6 photo-protection and homoeostasis-domain-containing protein [Desarmillaria ectypa]